MQESKTTFLGMTTFPPSVTNKTDYLRKSFGVEGDLSPFELLEEEVERIWAKKP
jgi:hypothetical protein